jgi:hypothetical protein
MKIYKNYVSAGHAVEIPAEFARILGSDEITLEIVLDQNHNPSLIITPGNVTDTIENDPMFALFIEALYRDTMDNPQMFPRSLMTR